MLKKRNRNYYRQSLNLKPRWGFQTSRLYSQYFWIFFCVNRVDTPPIYRDTVYLTPTMGVIGFLPTGAWLLPAVQAPAGQAPKMQYLLVWFTLPSSQANMRFWLVPCSTSTLQPFLFVCTLGSGARLQVAFCTWRDRPVTGPGNQSDRHCIQRAWLHAHAGNQSPPKWFDWYSIFDTHYMIWLNKANVRKWPKGNGTRMWKFRPFCNKQGACANS
jgi:hypothetical protein